MKNLEHGIVLQYLQNSQFPEAQRVFYAEIKQKGGLDLPLFIKQAQTLPTVDAARQLTVLEQIIEGIQDQATEKDEILRQNAQLTADLIGLKRNLQQTEQDQQRIRDMQRQLQDDKAALLQLQDSKNALAQELQNQRALTQEAKYQTQKQENAIQELTAVNLSFQEKDRNYQVLAKDLQLKLEEKGSQLVQLQQKAANYAASIQKMKQALAERDVYIQEITQQANQNVDNMKKYEADSQKQINLLQEQRSQLQEELQQQLSLVEKLQAQTRRADTELTAERRLTAQIPQHLDKIAALEQSLRVFQTENFDLKQTLEQQRREQSAQQAQIQQNEQLQNQAAQQFKTLNDTITQLQAEKLRLQSEQHQLQMQLVEVTQNCDTQRRAVETLKANIRSLPEFAEVQLQLEQLRQQFAQKQVELDISAQKYKQALEQQSQNVQNAQNERLQALNELSVLRSSMQTQVHQLQLRTVDLENQLTAAQHQAAEAAQRAEDNLNQQIQANYQLDARISDEIAKSKQLETTIKQLKDAQQAREAASANTERAQLELVQATARISTLEHENQLVRAAKSELATQIQTLLVEQHKLQTQSFETKLAEERTNTQNQILQARLSDAQCQLRSHEQLIQTLQQSITAPGSLLTPSVISQDDLEAQSTKLRDARQQITELKAQLEDFQTLQANHASLMQQVQDLQNNKNECERLRGCLQEYERANSQLNAEIASQIEQIQRYQENAQLQKELQKRADENLNQLREQFNVSLAQFKQDSEQNMVQMQSQREYIQELSRQVSDLKAQNELLSEMARHRSDSPPEVQLQPEKLQSLENSVVAAVQTAKKSVKRQSAPDPALQRSKQDLAQEQLDQLYKQLEEAQTRADIAQQALMQAQEAYERQRTDQEARLAETEAQLAEAQRLCAAQMRAAQEADSAVQSAAESARNDNAQLLLDYEQQIDLQIQCLQQKEQEIQDFVQRYQNAAQQLPERIRGQTSAFFQLSAVADHVEAVFTSCAQSCKNNQDESALLPLTAKIDEILSQNQIFEAERLKGLEILQQFLKSDQIQLSALEEERKKAADRASAVEADLQSRTQELSAAQLKIRQFEQLSADFNELQSRCNEQRENEAAYAQVLQERALQDEKAKQAAQVIADQNALISVQKEQLLAMTARMQEIEANAQQLARQTQADALMARNALEERMQDLRMQNARALDQLAAAKKEALDAQTAYATAANNSLSCEQRLENAQKQIESLNAALANAQRQIDAMNVQIRAIEDAKTRVEHSLHQTTAQLSSSAVAAQQSEAAQAQVTEMLKTRIQEMQRQLAGAEDEKEGLRQQMRANALEFEKVVQQILSQQSNASRRIQ